MHELNNKPESKRPIALQGQIQGFQQGSERKFPRENEKIECQISVSLAYIGTKIQGLLLDYS